MENIEFYPLKDMTTPKGGIFKIYADHYWIVDKQGNLLKYRGMSWQCNVHKEVAENIRNNVYPDYDVVQLPFVYTPWND